MLIDAAELADGEVLTTEVCVIGAGAAGITLARSLAGAGIDVVVLESGDMEPDPATQALYEGDVTGEPLISFFDTRRLDQIRLRYFGGTTNHWAGFCRPLQPLDFEDRPWLDVSGWPITLADLTPWYESAAQVLRLASSDFDIERWQADADIGPTLVDGPFESVLFQIQFPYSLGAVYQGELDRSQLVRVILGANVTSIDVQPEGDEIERVRVATLSGTRFTCEARAYVVATGGIEVPRLLLASDEVRSAGLGNANDLVGRYFTEHLQVLAGVAAIDRPAEELRLYAGTDVAAPYEGAPDNVVALKGALSLTREAVRREQILGMEVQILSTPPRPGSPEYRNGLGIGDVIAMLRAANPSAGQATSFVQVLGEQELDPASRVTLGTTTDALGMRRVELDWRHSELDRRSVLTGLDLLGRELGSTGRGRLQLALGGVARNEDISPDAGALGVYELDLDNLDLESFPIGIGYHHMCTTRMADSPSQGVVDADCRVHGTANLYVAGSAVFATGGVATPTYTIVALALRLADHLKDRVG